MRFFPLTSLFLLPISALQIPSIFAPFNAAHFDEEAPLLFSNDTILASDEPPSNLQKRANNCPNNYNSCSTLAAADAGACCSVGSVCSLDNNRQIACCSIGATCTGTIDLATSATTATTTGVVVFGTSTTTTTTNTGSTTPSPTSTVTTTTGTASYVSNTYFPFPYIPTTYSNSAACNSAFQACQTNYALCTEDLEGAAVAGVTISAPNGGVTVAPTVVNVGTSSAMSICSSLSNVACYGIVSSNCAQFGTGTGSGEFILFLLWGEGIE